MEFADRKGRIIALDIGSKRTGVAVSDEHQRIGFPLTQFEAKSKKEWLEQVKGLIEDEQVEGILVGLPLNHRGESGPDALNIQTYIALLREKFAIPVIEWDERFTTVQAERALLDADLSRTRRKQVIDKLAATIILQSYLDSMKFNYEDDQQPFTD